MALQRKHKITISVIMDEKTTVAHAILAVRDSLKNQIYYPQNTNNPVEYFIIRGVSPVPKKTEGLTDAR